MNETISYIQVIVPLRLDWEPYYSLDEGEQVCVGDMVAVPFAGRRYVAVVSAVNVRLPEGVPAESVKGIYSVHSEMPRVRQERMSFWRQIALYYMCTVGEVMKMACPASRSTLVSPRKKRTAPVFTPSSVPTGLSDDSNRLLKSLEAMLKTSKVCLLHSSADFLAMVALSFNVMKDKNVLWLLPDKELCKLAEKSLRPVFGSRLLVCAPGMTSAGKAAMEREMESGRSYLMIGTRSAVFAPHDKLGLVVVLDEHDAAYKQISPSPRYNARDAAIILASQYEAKVLLQSASPSFESIYNCRSGKFSLIAAPCATMDSLELEVIDVKAELRKNGMAGDVPKRILYNAEHDGPVAFIKLRKALFPKMDELLPRLHELYGEDVFASDDTVKKPVPQDAECLCLFGVDSLLSRNDFRADERVLQEVGLIIAACPRSLKKIYAVTRQPGHALFKGKFASSPLLAERKEFGFPPFTRLVDVHLRRDNAQRYEMFSRELLKSLVCAGSGKVQRWQVCPIADGFRIILPKDRNLVSSKLEIQTLALSLERRLKCPNMACFDVDP